MVPQAFKPVSFQVFLDFWGAPGLHTIIVSGVAGLWYCRGPSNHYSFPGHQTFIISLSVFLDFKVLHAIKPLWFQVFLDFRYFGMCTGAYQVLAVVVNGPMLTTFDPMVRRVCLNVGPNIGQCSSHCIEPNIDKCSSHWGPMYLCLQDGVPHQWSYH